MAIKILGMTFGTERVPEAITPEVVTAEVAAVPVQAENVITQGGWEGGYNSVFVLPFNGESEFGSIGQMRKYVMDHAALRTRSYQLDMDNDIISLLFKRSAIWGIGTGLKLQASPEVAVLATEGITLEGEDFNNAVESRFKVFAHTSMCDYRGLSNLSEMGTDGWSNAEKGGDVLVIMRLVDGMPKVELKDGSHVRTPLDFTGTGNVDYINPTTKNRVRHGVELDKRGQHVAYYVQTGMDDSITGNFERIECRMSVYPYSELARMVYGDKYRIDNSRGIPIIAAVMETAVKIGRYMSATLSSAEERAKIAYTIEHEKFSTGESPIVADMVKASGIGLMDSIPSDSLGNELANKFAVTTNKQAINLTQGSSIKSLESKQELHVKDFFTVNFDIVCAVIGYPPEVMLSKYDSNYSASRAAIKDFEHTLDVKRARFARQFYQVIYNFCLDVWVLEGSITAPGYLEALANRNEMALSAYRYAKWVGDNVPHIDPLKEVQAWRLKMGAGMEHIPLCTSEEAAEALSGMDINSVMEQSAKEREKAYELGIEKVELNKETIEGFGEEDEDKPGKPGRKKNDKKEEPKK